MLVIEDVKKPCVEFPESYRDVLRKPPRNLPSDLLNIDVIVDWLFTDLTDQNLLHKATPLPVNPPMWDGWENGFKICGWDIKSLP
jgi:hypothetical protein